MFIYLYVLFFLIVLLPSSTEINNVNTNYVVGQNYNRGGWRGRARGRGRGFVPRNKNTLKFENDYDFEQANTEFEELRSQLAKTKISDEVVVKPEVRPITLLLALEYLA